MGKTTKSKAFKISITIFIIVVLVSSFIALAISNSEIKVIQPNLESQVAKLPNYPLGSHTSNYTAFGNFSVTAYGTTQTYRYFLLGLAPGVGINVLNKSIIEQLGNAHGPILNLYLTGVSFNGSVKPTFISISKVTLFATDGMPVPPINLLFYNGNISIVGKTWSWSNYTELLDFPGIHQCYLNFTATAYVDWGPFKVGGHPAQVSIEWKTTISP